MTMPSRELPGFGSSIAEEDNIVKHRPLYWDERDKYTDEQWGVLDRIGAEMYGRKIHFTELGTVIISEKADDKKEIMFSDFIKEKDKKIGKEESAIKYDKETNTFYVVEKETCLFSPKVLAYRLDINEDVMTDYAFGKYNEVTSKLHELYLKSMTNEEKNNMIKQKADERKAVVLKMDTTHELPTPAEARIYLDYLEDMTAENNKGIRKNAADIASSTIIPTASGIAFASYCSTLADATVGGALLCGIAGVFAAASANDLYLTSLKDAEHAIFPGATTVRYIKKNFKDIKAKLHDNKMIKMKASKLLEIENVDRMVIAKSYSMEEFDSTLTEEDKLESLNLKNTIMNNLDELVNRINLLNAENKKEFLFEVRTVLAEYTERYNKIINQDTSVIDLDADNFMKLKVDMLMKIADLESRVAEVRLKDVEIKQVTDESKLLTEKIDGFTQLDSIDLELQKTHENTMKKVKVKNLKEKKSEKK